MKPFTILLAGSIAANAALLALLIAGSVSGKTSNSVPSPVPSSTVATKSTSAAISLTSWSDLRPDDLAGLAARLRAVGLPSSVIRALLVDQVRTQFAARRAAFNRDAPSRRFWEKAASDPQTAAALARLDKEEKQAIEAVLGPDAALDDPAFASLRRQLPDFSTEKILAIHRIQRSYAEKSQELFSAGVFVGIENRDTLEKERNAEIAGLLTPEELEEFDLRTGNAANNLRNRLASVTVTEQEFRALHRLQQAFDDQYGRSLNMIDLPADQRSAMMRQRSDAQRQLTEQIKNTLGEQRYADYQRASDGSYSSISRVVDRLGLPPETTNQVYAVQQDLQQRANTVQSNRALPLDDRNAQLAVIATEAQSRVTALLGPNGYDAYSLNGGFWLRQLQPRAATPAGGRGGGSGR